MASALKGAIKSAAGRSTSPSQDPEAQQEAEKYRLHVTAGGAYDLSTHKPVRVNTGNATYIENDFLRAKVQVRVRGYRGLPTSCPSSSPYFDDPSHEKDQYSLAFSFVPKVDLPSVDTVWGNDFDHPVRDRLPPGFNTAFKIVKEFIDPGLSCDAYADQPWLYGPSLSCWFAFVVGEKVGEGEDFAAPDEENPMREGGEGSGGDVRLELGIPDNNEKRRKYFLDAKHREQFTFEKGRSYQADFYNPYLDFGNFALKLPGFSLKVIKYVDQKSHNLRYVFKNRQTGDVYLNVNFGLLWGDDLKDALEAEKQGQEPEPGQNGTNGGSATSGANEHSVATGGETQSPSPQEPQESSDPADNEPLRSNGRPDAPVSHPRGSDESYQAKPPQNRPGASTDHPTESKGDDEAKQSRLGLPQAQPTSSNVSGRSQESSTRDPSQQGPRSITVDEYLAEKPAAADAASGKDASGVDEISDMLQASATSDRRGNAGWIL